MHHARTTRGTYVAAFLLGALIALLLVAPARSAESTRFASHVSPRSAAALPGEGAGA